MKKYFYNKFFLCLVLLAFVAQVKAQIKREAPKASIILLKGKQLFGNIINETLSNMNMGISFKASESDEFKTYTTSDFTKLIFENGETYEVLQVSLLKDTVDTNILGALILKGKISVYAIKYNNEYVYVLLKDGKTFCLQNDELKPYELTVTKHFFKDTLFNAVADGGISDKEVEKISYSKNDIIAVVTKYNQNKNYDSEVLTYKLEKESYLIAGLSANPIDKNDYEALANISYRFYIPRFSKTTSLNFGLQYSYRESKIYYLDGQNGRQISNPISSGIFLPMFVQQNILNKSVRPYLRGGFSLVYTHQKKYANSISNR